MKLSRNVLVGSLATTGMVLGLIAPSLTELLQHQENSLMVT